jgi:HAD superfamily hydrolase (TIGR01509 family)
MPTGAPSERLPAAVVFDWDGTLVDTMAMIYRANLASLRPYGMTMTRAWFRERYTPDWRRGYQELGVPEHLWDEMSERWAEAMAGMRPRAMPWARQGLRDLRRRGVRLGLVTASTRGVVEPNLARLNLDGMFETAWYADDVARSKPDPEALLRALGDLGLAAADTVYVGDTTVDLEMASAAGAAFVAVGTTTPPGAFRLAGVETVWAGVGAWVDDLLGKPPRVRATRGGSPRPPPGSHTSAGGSAARPRRS